MRPSLSPGIGEALAALRASLEARFGDRLVDLRLFGSNARGEAGEESDIDVLVLVRDVTAAESRGVADLAVDAGLHRDLVITPFVRTPEAFDRLRRLERRIALEIDREGIPV